MHDSSSLFNQKATWTTFVYKSVFLPFLNKVASLLLQVFNQDPECSNLPMVTQLMVIELRLDSRPFFLDQGALSIHQCPSKGLGMVSWEESML